MNLRKPRSLSSEVNAAVKYLHVGLITIILGSCFVFLFNLSQSSVNGYEFRQQELELEQAEDVNHKLKMQTLEAQSYEELEASIKFKEMIEPGEIDYIESRLNRLTKN